MSEVNTDRGSGPGARGPDDSFADYERELKAALSIEPSASFEARVRLRIEEDSAHGRFSWTPAFTWLAAAASLVIVVGVVYLLQRSSPDDLAQPPQMATARPDVTLPAFPPAAHGLTPPAHALTPPAHKGPAYGAEARRSAREPEVIVVNQMDAVRRLVAAVADGRLVVPEAPDGPVEAPDEMVIAPLVVEPMLVPAVEGDPIAPVPDIRKTK